MSCTRLGGIPMSDLRKRCAIVAIATACATAVSVDSARAQLDPQNAFTDLAVQDAAGTSVLALQSLVPVEGEDGLLELLGTPKLGDKATLKAAKKGLKSAGVALSSTVRYDRTILQEGATKPI